MRSHRILRQHVFGYQSPAAPLAAWTGFAVVLIAISGCQRQAAEYSATQPQVTVTPMLGGAGGLMVQISGFDLVSVYHLPPKALDRRQPGPDQIDLDLILQFNPKDAGGERLPVRLKPAPPPSPGDDAAQGVDA
jgi:hypothetical protein